ncbi:hypothetical protein F0L17_01455 [Streptomyces sp. TRM43335]|uniref:Uncharacterized protein n=1 Tax=Streptomyces taklimakanensis TaxID=2569853 RepID=A0A6G2B6E8_9ACTN|nr:hypothetical protein [Streptomyces taklimakanensis]MTE17820.1 hypothetical protein [Streptomyces taklimakanensis]
MLLGDLVATLKTPEGSRFSELGLVEEHGADLDVAALWAALGEVPRTPP